MREDRPSITASAVAFARGVASLPGRSAPSHDPIAKELLRPPLGALLRGLEPISERTGAVALALRIASLGLVDHLALRTAAIDEVLNEACGGERTQLVILGAGLDARAYRLPVLSNVTVFEVDHPATQRFKRSRVRTLEPIARALRFVAVDFEHERLGARLEEEGHDSSIPTVWVWEGVVPYLPLSATRDTLTQIASRSAASSILAVTYVTNEDRWLARLARPVHAAFRLLGEPLRGVTTRERFHELLAEAGWHVKEDTSPHDWHARYGYAIDALLTLGERLVVAES
jgi:methyltransferase (TIGR00027 family)